LTGRVKNGIKRRVKKVFNQANRRHCPACGRFAVFGFSRIYTPELAAGHGFDARWTKFYDKREGRHCTACWTNARSMQIAKVLIAQYGPNCSSLNQLCDHPGFRALRVAEINECRMLHQFLARLPGLRYSEFGSTDPAVPHENVMDLSYADESFDLVLTSETLEHIPDVQKGLSEIRRVLRPGGLHVFTIPVRWGEATTRIRAKIEGGEIVHILPPCYHGGSLNPMDCLAFYEYGRDVVEIVRNAGFDVNLVEDPKNPALKTFLTRRI
jgi:SAM-dependent methyltransferase